MRPTLLYNISPLSPFHWPQNTWPWMAILRSIFIFSLQRTMFWWLGYILIIELFIEYFYMTSPAKMCGSRQWNCDPQNNAAPRKDCRSFVEEKLWAIHCRNLNKKGQHYYIILFSALSSFHWLQNTWPWNDREWPFYDKYSLLWTEYQQLSYIYCKVHLHTWPTEMCGSGQWSAEN